MGRYRVKFSWNGGYYAEEVCCYGSHAARMAILARYPHAHIYHITVVREK